MMGRLVIVTGTGTEIGKTHLSEALLLGLGSRGVRAAGVKPVESGVGAGESDADRLARASTFHVKPSAAALRAPISPHLAARREGVVMDLPALARGILAARDQVDVLLVELPGGLFTPLSEDQWNVDFARSLAPDLTVLVAPDRLGVLHDVLATATAAGARGLRLDAIVLVQPPVPDATTTTNAGELRRLQSLPVAGVVPRASPRVLADDPAIALLTRLVLPPPAVPAPA